jgi:hypothetical protein
MGEAEQEKGTAEMSNANEAFEALAAEFYGLTAMLAPGKDQPAADCGYSMEERNSAWHVFKTMRRQLAAAQADNERLRAERMICHCEKCELARYDAAEAALAAKEPK